MHEVPEANIPHGLAHADLLPGCELSSSMTDPKGPVHDHADLRFTFGECIHC